MIRYFKPKCFSDQKIPYGEYADKILDLANQTFTGMYHSIYKQYWHDNKFLAKMNQCYTTTDRENAVYETYMPTADNPYGLGFYRIAIKIVPEVNSTTFHQEAEKLRTPLHTPMGQLDSELQIIISPKLSRWGFIRAYKHNKKPGYLSTIYITKTKDKQTGKTYTTPPEVLWVKIVRAIATFLDIRLTAYLKTLKIQPYQKDAKDNNQLYYICNSVWISRLSHSLRNTLLCLSQSLDHLLHKIWVFKAEIGVQTKAFQCTVEEMRVEITFLQKAIKEKCRIENSVEARRGLLFLEALKHG